MPGNPPQTLDEIFGHHGWLSRTLPGFEYRRQQHELALAASSVFQTGGSLLAEAGTGTGKTIAYLIPALLSGMRTIVSTGTKNLQEQIYHKDIPLLRELLPGFSAAYLKGRANYLCRNRLAEISKRPYLPGSREADFAAQVSRWGASTETGDRSELEWLADDDPLWNWVSAEHEACLGGRCPHLAGCFVARARRKAAAADLVVVNHHLLVTEAAAGEVGAGFLPEAGNLVCDEAHLLEDVATRLLGVEAGSGALARVLSDLSPVAEKAGDRLGARLVRRGFELLDRLQAALPAAEGAFPLRTEEPSTVIAALRPLGELLREVRAGLLLLGESDESQELQYLAKRAARLAEAIDFICTLGDPDFIYWFDRRERSVTFWASPVDVSADLPRVLFDRFRGILLTSATLAIRGDFGFFKDRLGLPGAGEFIADSPFDFRRQSVFYVPTEMPDPNSGAYAEAVARGILPLLKLSRGRAFVLCTSRRALEVIQGVLSRETSYRVFRQGEAPRSVLLAEFTRSPHAVLVATTSFWQGVDVPGEALSAVIIDRLPFASPDDPVTGGRITRIRDRGGQPFRDYQLPAAVIMLKQGLGRLIRRRTDRGLLAVMDPRLRQKSYGKVFLASLPPMNLVGDLKSLAKAYRELQHEA